MELNLLLEPVYPQSGDPKLKFKILLIYASPKNDLTSETSKKVYEIGQLARVLHNSPAIGKNFSK